MNNLDQQLRIDKIARSLANKPELFGRQYELLDFMTELKSCIRKDVTRAFEHLTTYRADVYERVLNQAIDSVEYDEALSTFFVRVADIISRYEMANEIIDTEI